MISFDYWLVLPLAVLLPVAIVWLLGRGDRDRRSRLARLGDDTVVPRILPPGLQTSARERVWLLAIAGALAGLGLAGPRWGVEQTIVRARGLDMVFALDASLSMMATDDKPSRMERMKQEVRRLRAMSGGDRVGLIAFAGRSYVLSPLTVDVGALDLFLDNLDPSVVGQAGSSLARAIRQGTDLLSLSKGGADRALVIMSDGEAFEAVEDVTAEARRAGQQGIAIVTVGFGTQEGSRIPIPSATCRDSRQRCAATEFKKDENGEIVVTKYHPEFLRGAAEAANGTFIDAAHTDKATRVRGALASLRRQQRLASAGETRTPRYQWFLLPALLLLGIDTIRSERVRRRRPRSLTPAAPEPRAESREPIPESREPRTAALAAVALLLMLGGCAGTNRTSSAARSFHAGQPARAAALYRSAINGGDKSIYTLYNYGTSLLAADSMRLAAEVLERAAESQIEEIRYRALFNLGLSHLRQGLALPPQQAKEPLDAALATYKKVLLLRSSDPDAKWNYELALRKKQDGGGGGGGGSSGNDPQPAPEDQSEKPSGGLGEKQAEQLLGSAAREERDVQQKRQQKTRVSPPGGKDW